MSCILSPPARSEGSTRDVPPAVAMSLASRARASWATYRRPWRRAARWSAVRARVTGAGRRRARPPAPTVLERRRAAAIARRHGSDTLANFALRADRSFCFAPGGDAFVPFVVLGGFALSPGGPIGALDQMDGALDAFEQLCARHRWRPAYVSVPSADLGRYRRRRLRHFYFGDEAVVRIADFSLAGKRNKSLRQSVQRIARDHELLVVSEHDLSPELAEQLEALSERWRAGAPERGFSMATARRVGDGPAGAKLFVAMRRDDPNGVSPEPATFTGTPSGFLRVLPVTGDPSAWTLDAMRREPTSPNGVTEFLVARTIGDLRERGAERFSVNFAVMARLYRDDHHNSRGDRALVQMMRPFNHFFPFKSLYDSNRRYRPEWVSRVLVYRSHLQLPFITVLYFGLEGYLSWPLVGRWFDPERFARRNAAAWSLATVDEVIDLRDSVARSSLVPRPEQRDGDTESDDGLREGRRDVRRDAAKFLAT